METAIEDPLGTPPSFESVWTDIAGPLERALIATGVSHSMVEDVVQETGVRLFVRWKRIDKSGSLMPLAFTIARRLVVDHHRKQDRVELRETPLEVDLAIDAEQTALARIHLNAVLRTIHLLNPRYQRLLLAETGFLGAKPSGIAERTARSRARHRLEMLLERASDAAWAITAPVVALSRRSVRLREMLYRADWAVMGQAAASAFLFFVSLAAPLAIAETPDFTAMSPQLVASAHEGGHRAGIQTSTSLDGTVEQWEAPRISSDEGSAGPTSTGLLPPFAASKGHNSGSGHTGLAGFNEIGEGTGTIAGETIEWTYHAEYRQPQCVRWALQGRPGPGCDAAPEAGAGGSVEYQDQEVGFDTPD